MKEIISISVKSVKADVVKVKADVLVIGVFADSKTNALCEALDKKLGGAIGNVLKLKDFKGAALSTAVLYGNDKIGAKRVVLVGLGERKKVTTDSIRKAAGVGASKAVDLRAKTVAVAVHQEMIGRKGYDAETIGRIATEGAYFGGYRYDEYVAKSKDDRPRAISVTLIDSDSSNIRGINKGLKTGQVFGEAQNYARTIMNRPSNVINPPSLAAEAKRLAKGTTGLSCTVLTEKEIKAKKMGGLMAVGQGSATKPRLIILKYTPSKKTSGKVKTVGLVGKAVTFDSGGISIKPGPGMHDMKFDKTGGCAVLGAMKAIAGLKPAVAVYGIIPSAENMPDGGSYRPGDIITTYSGKTVEIQNTDAEGRMILCDAIHHAVKLKCDAIVDAATLTGACVIALGEWRAGLMSNNDRQIKELQDAADATGDQVWHMPCGDEYLELMKSKIADLKNIGGKWAGSCTAGAFLREFAGDTDWAHLDIAGPGVVDGSTKFGSPGSIGFGVKLLAEYARSCGGK